MVRRFAAGCFAAAGVGLAAQAQPIDSLFRDVDGPAPDIAASQATELRGLTARAIRTRIVRVDLETLAAMRRALLLPGRDPGTLSLFDDTEFEVIFEKSVPAVSGYALQGRLLGIESGIVTFVVRGQTVTGTVTTSNGRYTITPGADGTHVITEVDWTLAPEGEPVPPEDSPEYVFDQAETMPTRRRRAETVVPPTARSDPPPMSATRRLPTVNSNAWLPQGPGATGRNGGLLDGQVENVEPNNAVIGAIHTVLAHPTDADILYIGAVNGGVWKTTNATATDPDWTPLIDDMGAMSIGAMAFDRTDPETVLVGFGRYSSFFRSGGDRNGLLLTKDGGATWTKLDDPLLIDMNVSGLSIDGDRLVVAGSRYTVREGHRGVVRSADGGVTWRAVAESDGLPESSSVLDMVDDPSNADRFYASVQYTGIFRSDDGGATWSHASANDAAIQAVMTHWYNNNAEMAVAHDGRLYLAAMIGGQAQYIGYTDDQGATWTEMDLPQTPESDGDIEGLNPRFKAGAQGYIHFSIRVDPLDADVVYVGGDRQDAPFPNYIGARDYTGRLFRGNASVEATGEVPSPQWKHLTHSSFIAGIPGGGTASNSAPHADSREMVFDADGDLIQVDDGGIYRRTSPGSYTGDWFSLNGNLQVTEMHDVAYDTLANVVVSGNQDVGNSHQTTGGSLYWDSLTHADGGDVVIDVREAEGRSIRYLSLQYLRRFNGHIYDANNERIGFLAPAMLVNGSIRLSEWEPNLRFVQRFELNAVNPNRVVLGASALYESYDQFETFEESFVLDFDLDPFDFVRATAYGCAGDPDLLYVAHGVQQGPRIDVRARRLAAPDFVQTGYPGGSPRDILINRDTCETVYVIDAENVWSSTDTGETWQDITGNLLDDPVRYPDRQKLEFIPAGEIFAQAAIAVAGRGGVHVMEVTAPGEWYDLGASLPDAPVFDLDYDPDDRLLVAGTLGRGAWLILSAAPVVQIGILDQDMEVDDESTLDISNLFYSTDETLAYTVSSSDASVVAASLTGTGLVLRANRAGAVTITVVATDDDGLTGAHTFTVTVGTVVSFAAAAEAVAEGARASFTIELNRSSTTAINVDYSIVPGDGAGTAPADADDHTGTDGTLSFAAGETSQRLDIRISDDDAIEPVREAFTIRLEPPTEDDAWGLGIAPAATVQIKEGVCDRTPAVRDALSPRVDCSEVSELDIASIRRLKLEKIDSFKPRDLLGLAGLSRLEIVDGSFTSLPEALFGGLASLVTMEMTGNDLEMLPGRIFDGLSRLKTLRLASNQLTDMPEAVFEGVPALERLEVTGNALTELPGRVFGGLHALKVLRLDNNQLLELPEGIFDSLTALASLDVAENQLTALPSDVFDNLTELGALGLDRNQLARLPDGVFDGPRKLGLLTLNDNHLAELPAGGFSGLGSLSRLYVNDNQLTALPAGVFEGTESLTLVHLQDNPGAPFPLTVRPVRTDSAALTDPGPATLEASVAEGAPFPMSADLAVANGTLSEDKIRLAPGQTASESFTVTEENGKAIVEVVEVTRVPPTHCGISGACFQGIETFAGDAVVLFEGPGVVNAIIDQSIDSIGDSLVFELSDLFSAEPGTTLTFSVVTSDAALVTASLDGSVLTIAAAGEGDATVAVTATDDLGRIATFEFDVTVGLPLGSLRGWRLGVLAKEANAAEEDDEAAAP
ncbi:MAG: leucine-rich repeat protein [Gammaproteobacteria bacterium]|nr:leucine-rich repeat protein [Gammaproteobacteria bacterium]